jgi:hypothetical protein
MDEKQFFDKFSEILEKSRPSRETKDYQALLNSIMMFNTRMKESIKNTSLINSLTGIQQNKYKELQETLEDYKLAMEKATTEEEKRELDRARSEAEKLAVDKEILETKIKFVTGTVEVTKKLVTGVTSVTADLVKNLQSGGTGINTAGGAIKGALDIASTGANAAGSALTGLGGIMSNSINPKMRAFGMGLSMLGMGTQKVFAGLSALGKFGIDVLSTELTKTIETYKLATSAGALFANGMTELRNAAHEAGLSVVTLSNIIKNNSESLYVSGLNLGAATQMISAVFKNGGNSFKQSLLNLGYGFEEQGALVAETMKFLSIAGNDLRNLDNQTIRTETEKYAINLKTISAITGDDAKKRLEESRRMAANALVQSKLARMDTATRDQFLKDLAVIPPTLRSAVLQQRYLGVVVDKNAATLMGIVPEIADNIRDFGEGLGQGSEVMGKLRESFATNVRLANETGKLEEIGVAGLVALGGAAGDLAQFLSELTLDAQQGAKISGATNEIVTALNQMKAPVDGLTTTINAIVTNSERMTAEIEKAVTPHLSNIAALFEVTQNIMLESIKAAGEFLVKLKTDLPNIMDSIRNLSASSVAESSTSIVGAIAGALAGGKLAEGAVKMLAGPMSSLAARVGSAVVGRVIGGLVGSLAGPAGMFLGAYLGEQLTSKILEMFGSSEGGPAATPTPTARSDTNSEVPQPYAVGGIASGPTTGYLAKLHGVEAVVPLPNGKSIPVSMVNDSRTYFTNDVRLDRLSENLTQVKNSIDNLNDNVTTLTIPPEFKTSMELSNASLKEVIREQTVLIRDYNEKLERLLSVATDNKNINQQILNATY